MTPGDLHYVENEKLASGFYVGNDWAAVEWQISSPYVGTVVDEESMILVIESNNTCYTSALGRVKIALIATSDHVGWIMIEEPVK